MTKHDIIHLPIEEQPLLWAAVVWVSLQYQNETTTKKVRRPQQVYQQDDGKIIGRLIVEIRRQLGGERFDRSGIKFQTVKARVLQSRMNEGLSVEKRNFYSSVIATFFSWTYHGTPESRREIVNLIASFPPPPRNLNRNEG